MKTRGFEVISSYADEGIHIPERKTSGSSGYDLEASDDCIIWPHVVTAVPTGLKAYMQDDECLFIFIRSSMAFKKNITLANSVGIIDSDYYNNPDNEGHLILCLVNNNDKAITIKKGDRIAQGIFMKYLTCDNDCSDGQRTGGFGSTGK